MNIGDEIDSNTRVRTPFIPFAEKQITINRFDAAFNIVVYFYDVNNVCLVSTYLMNKNQYIAEYPQTFNVPPPTRNIKIDIGRIDGAAITPASLTGKEFKVEKGNIATSWSPSDKDIQSNIAAVTSYIDGAFRDGVIDKTEKSSIKKYLNQINTDWESVYNLYLTINGNSNLTGGQKTALDSAYPAALTAKNNLITSINTAIDDNAITESEKADVDDNFATYSAASALLQKRIQEASDYINAVVAQAKANAASVDAKAYADVMKTNLQGQIDGNIISWFRTVDALLSNTPASDWNTEVLRNQHANDTYTNTSNGKCWRYQYNGSTLAWEWGVISDTATQQALTAAGKAQDTADGKRTTFAVQPTTAQAYQIGDLWVGATVGIYTNELLKCVTAKAAGATFNVAHWTLATKYTDDTFANNIQIGGRNLLLNTVNLANKKTITATANDYNLIFPLIKCTLVAGQQYIFSIKTDGIWGAAGSTDTVEAFLLKDGAYSYAISLDTNPKIFIPTQSGEFTLRLDVNMSGKTYSFWDMQVASGNKVTDYNAAPEDINAAITAATTYVDGAFKDGLITQTEAQSISKYINQINADWSATYSQYSTIYANSNLIGTPKTNLLNSQISASGAKTNLINSINTAIADGKTTTTEKADVDAKFALYSTAMSDFQKKIQEANDAINTNVTKAAADLAYYNAGGRNIVLDSALKTLDAGTSNFAFLNLCDLKRNTTYTVSCKSQLKSGAATSFTASIYSIASSVGLASAPIAINSTTRQKMTFTTPDTAVVYNILIYAGIAGATAGNIIDFIEIKAEEGLLDSRWTLAEEDFSVIAALAQETSFLNEIFENATPLVTGGDANGGSWMTNLLRMRGTDGIVRGGMSGLAGDNIGTWTGGTYANAIASSTTPSSVATIDRKDGSGHRAWGNILWDTLGNVSIKAVLKALAGGEIGMFKIFNKSLSCDSIEFSDEPVETLASLLIALSASITDIGETWVAASSVSGVTAYSEPLVLTVASKLKFYSKLRTDGEFPAWDVSIYDSLGNLVYLKDGENFAGIQTVLTEITLPKGSYVLSASAVSQGYNRADIYGFESAETITANAYTKRTKIGNNGLYSFQNAQKYFYFSEDMVDIPAGLGGASIGSNGVVTKWWGKILNAGKVVKATNNYTITHDIGDTNYSIILTPKSTNVPYFLDINRLPNTIIVTCAGGFDFVLIRTQ